MQEISAMIDEVRDIERDINNMIAGYVQAYDILAPEHRIEMEQQLQFMAEARESLVRKIDGMVLK